MGNQWDYQGWDGYNQIETTPRTDEEFKQDETNFYRAQQQIYQQNISQLPIFTGKSLEETE